MVKLFSFNFLNPETSPSLVKIILLSSFLQISPSSDLANFIPISLCFSRISTIFFSIYLWVSLWKTLPVISIFLPLNVQSTASGDEHPPPTVFKNFRSSFTQISVSLF